MHKTLYPLVLLLSCCVIPTCLLAGEYDGDWIATVTTAASSCKFMGKDIEGDYTAVIRQNEGTTLTLTVKETGTVFNGVQMKAAPGEQTPLIHMVASYLEQAGIISQKMIIEMTDSHSGKGNTNWNWSDGLMICGGHYTFTLKREK
jgi:hypothetical protein